MTKMTQDEIKEILEEHLQWITTGGKEGKRANLTGTNLTGANLSNADLTGAKGMLNQEQIT